MQRLDVALAPADEGHDVEIIGVVAGLPAAIERGVRFDFAVEQVQTAGVQMPPRLSLAWYGRDAAVVSGERWAATVRLRRPHGNYNPGGFDLEAWLFERVPRAVGYVRDPPAPRRLAMILWSAGSAIDSARAELRARLQARVGGDRVGGVLIALVLGDQRAIAEPDWVLFNRTGVSHQVSISWPHITMTSGLVALAVGVLWRRSPRTLALPRRSRGGGRCGRRRPRLLPVRRLGHAGAAHDLHVAGGSRGGLAAHWHPAADDARRGRLGRVPARPVGDDRAELLALARRGGGDPVHDLRAAGRGATWLARPPARGGPGCRSPSRSPCCR